jgi:cysteinyl-tRNA synthetase
MVQNITDVGHMSEDFQGEDKILSESQKEGEDPLAIARRYESGFREDLTRLHIIPATHYPRASDHIQLMQDLIIRLLEKGSAYIGADNSIYFDASSFPHYGQLSGNRLESLKPGHRFEYSDEGGKRFHADWALWKTAGERREMIWDSPWGPGFPGWHIECSAMSLHYLDQSIDIHVGGIDLRFPHHENERAQSNAVVGKECVNLWVHGEHLLFEGRKMSKSSGNVVLLQDIVERGYDPLSIRLVFLENRYRSQMDLSWDSISAANKTLKRWRAFVASEPNAVRISNHEILKALNDDIDTPRAIQVIRAIEKDSSLSQFEKVGAFLFADEVFGLDLSKNENERALPADIRKILDERAAARQMRDWNESDRLRKVLESRGLVINDSKGGEEWSWR